ncbi:integrin beta-7 isoform X2 [Protopterus annectens]|nr:integrin beta-7 isoform X2 [Protopterus annectens]
MDLSYSMKDDLENIKKLGNDLLVALKNVTKSVKIGFGSFVDKTVLPYTNSLKSKLENPCPERTEKCQSPFSFKHVLQLTDNVTEFELKVSQQSISANLDSPEGGFDAMMQAAVCMEEIGWRNVTRLLVFTSDDTFHIAGDGRLGGIYLPNDGRCHLNKEGLYEKSNVLDYPSVGHLAHTLFASNIQPIFAVTTNTLQPYQELSKLIPKSAVGELKHDSSNVIQLITDAYNNLSSTINLQHFKLPQGFDISYHSLCGNGITLNQKQGQCSGVKIKEQVTFNVTLRAKQCLETKQSFQIRPLGFSEELQIEVETLCDCECHDFTENADYCSNGTGNFSCGICRCDATRLGRLCECDRSQIKEKNLDSTCRMDNNSLVCSGRGKCVCGKCECSIKAHGNFCQCDDSSCPRDGGEVCGGNGKCDCGICECNEGYSGDACDCSLSEDFCKTPEGVVCGGNGTCECNKCKCNVGYSGKMCELCITCKTPCENYRDCAECKSFGTGKLKHTCEESCSMTQIKMVKSSYSSGKDWCHVQTDGGLLTFVHEEKEDGTVILTIKEPPEQVNPIPIIIGVISGIVLIGMMLIIVYRVMVEVYDRREFHRFEKERQNVKWQDADNPLYKSATTTIINPKFQDDNDTDN